VREGAVGRQRIVQGGVNAAATQEPMRAAVVGVRPDNLPRVVYAQGIGAAPDGQRIVHRGVYAGAQNKAVLAGGVLILPDDLGAGAVDAECKSSAGDGRGYIERRVPAAAEEEARAAPGVRRMILA